MSKSSNSQRCKMLSSVSLTRQVSLSFPYFIIRVTNILCSVIICWQEVVPCKICDQKTEEKFRKRVKRYVGIWCCVKGSDPGHIYYDMYWDEKPNWKPIPPQASEDDHPPWWWNLTNHTHCCSLEEGCILCCWTGYII